MQPIVGDAVVRATVSSLYEAKPSGQAVMQGLASLREESKNAGLVGAHVVEIIATMQHGVAARALRTIGIDMETLRAAARTAAATYRP